MNIGLRANTEELKQAHVLERVFNRVSHGVCWGAPEGNRVAKQQYLSPLLQAGRGRGERGKEEGKGSEGQSVLVKCSATELHFWSMRWFLLLFKDFFFKLYMRACMNLCIPCMCVCP